MSADNGSSHWGVMASLATLDPNTKYFPIVLETVDQINPKNSWKLEFQTEPTTQVILTGGDVVSTTDSIVKVLSFMSNTPIWMVDVVRAIIGDKLIQRGQWIESKEKSG